LRFAYNLPRFSEDLDFSLEKPDRYKPVEWMKKIKRDLQLAGFETNLNWNDRKTVHTAWVKVGGIMKESGLAAMADQKLSIKLEIDTRPPKAPNATEPSSTATWCLPFNTIGSPRSWRARPMPY